MGKDRCIGCEYGRGYIEFGECPVCHGTGLLGNVRTREIHCPNGCSPLPFAVDFCAEQNCYRDVYRNGITLKNYRITIRGSMNTEQIILQLMEQLGGDVELVYMNHVDKFAVDYFYNEDCMAIL